MPKILLLFLIGLFFYSCSSTKNRKVKTKYFDENYTEISKSEFERIRKTNRLLDIPGDSAHHKKLTLRERHGKINNRALLESTLEKAINRELDSEKPLVIMYYPGKDPCNSSGNKSKNDSRINWRKVFEHAIYEVGQTKPIYIYKDHSGLQKGYDSIYHKDPNGIIERLFFKHHYPCSSFVVISKDGDFISYFGEHSSGYVITATKLMNK
ncbi:hypothetical protein ACFSQ0_05625 [Mesonia sediminis]|uniref:Uncharacterized protein n=1 Tax=Mesonia sediminis TaxID=1703946 RepID=A0ABW5SFJ8_9FLAO